ncbi:hypothetical protein FJ546_28545 [Mesorhizobium sp. B2-4-19]|uniref:hypothetical protein n=1 Tax=Mesorhizobium sp. B2-4-19 TaxID=2589930 RepID=UPI00112BA23E|nr:hypothetical protein [Mesorhizobium sp. B2-4-19]TPK55952.1 hypothetical protein FJ546_28545 [Mesorhizobium sp. B2-4-19]
MAIKAGMTSIGLTGPRLAGGTMCYLAEVAGAIFLILGRGVGLYIAALGTIVLFAFLISGAWLLHHRHLRRADQGMRSTPGAAEAPLNAA